MVDERFEEYIDEEERYEAADELLSELRGSGIIFRLVDGKVRCRAMSALSEVAKSELRRVKNEVAEILRDEDE
jgi:hypothetical protein